jgi:UDP-N-acetyl-D-glucosamine/UDP-N-acetyl-D-galactosamine dehydrogenase
MSADQIKVAVVGLGYVGLPLAVALARTVPVVGIDIDAKRVEQLRAHHDATGEIDRETLAATTLDYAADFAAVDNADVVIVTVPTPVDKHNQPDLGAVLGATRSIGGRLRAGRGTIIVYESTVYPGVTEDVCGPELEQASGLARGKDFFLGYSPERINPGDREHTVDRIVKVVAGESDAVTDRLAALYGAVTSGGVFRAASIKVAEAAKVIENAQRDINIAFMNEITKIFVPMGLSIYDVLATARTKWNFLDFRPGLVGGHCIGVDPFYLSYLAIEQELDPQVILAGRSTNDGMGAWIADRAHERLDGPSRVLLLGLTFKENVPDIRNSRVIDIYRRLRFLGHSVDVHDPLADPDQAEREYDLRPVRGASEGTYAAVVLAVAHGEYTRLDAAAIDAMVADGGLVFDIKGIWRDRAAGLSSRYVSL